MKEILKKFGKSLFWGSAILAFLIFVLNYIGIFVGNSFVLGFGITDPVVAFLVRAVAYTVTLIGIIYLYIIFSTVMIIKNLGELIKDIIQKRLK